MQKFWGKRGKFLTISLVIALLLSILSTISHLLLYSNELSGIAFLKIALLKPEVQFLILAISVSILIGIWKLKRIAVYLLLAQVLLAICLSTYDYIFPTGMESIIRQVEHQSVLSYLSGVLINLWPIYVLLFAIKGKWKDFS